MNLPLLAVRLDSEADLVAVRQRTRHLAEILGFDVQDQTRVATAVSEIARNALQHAGHGEVSFSIEGRTPPQLLTIVVTDRGPGIPDVQPAPPGDAAPSATARMGMVAARRLVDQFSVEARPGGGLQVTLRKVLPRHAPLFGRGDLPRLQRRATQSDDEGPLAELRQQNHELLAALAALRSRQEELVRLNQELEDTNRGVVALFAELDEKADHLRRADEMKSRFLSNMSHEFRTPLNAVRGLANLLLQRVDGDLSAEQEHQVRLIAKAASDLSELVDDLLDIAKVEAGKTVVRPVEFEVRNLFGALRGMLRPMLLDSQTHVVFEEPEGVPPLYTDEGKISQILRNFISNALKFTPSGEVRVSARAEGHQVRLAVSDTGIGIAPDDRERVFQEFVQLETPLQRRSKGTGLGLPLSRRLAGLLGGRIHLESTVGRGSTFTLEIPLRYQEPPEDAPEDLRPAEGKMRLPVLVVEDSPEMVLLYRNYLEGLPFEILHASTLAKAERALRRRPARAMILDILVGGEDAWTFMAELKASPETAALPIVVVTQVDDRSKAFALGADAFLMKPPDRRGLVRALHRALARGGRCRALVVDDEEASRYLLRKVLADFGWEVLEAHDGRRGVEMARSERPSAILLDLVMPGLDGFAALSRLEADPETRDIPVVIVTSQVLDPEADRGLRERTCGVVSKSLSRGDTLDQLGPLLLSAMLRKGTATAGAARRDAGE